MSWTKEYRAEYMKKYRAENREPKREQIHTCFLCDSPIYEDDIYYDVGDCIYCRHCVEEGRKTA